MKPIILTRLRALIDEWGDRATYRVLAAGDRWALVLIRRDDRVDPAGWAREAGD